MIDIGNSTIKYKNNNASGVSISAGTQDQYSIQNLNVEKGRYFVESETRAGH
ncbi:hypothetical protein L950_0220675 [Sphingobacterium sp. IITKGP-BTPF85]|nr:hypothetical protein [Sphingobacterium sp. IITKGP-BTPF85]KKX48508.1 hypothetical protein L950_0220675 [Sphingobacterium sp. IITKGP-BTPF85]